VIEVAFAEAAPEPPAKETTVEHATV
jgi:hypothetical protein